MREHTATHPHRRYDIVGNVLILIWAGLLLLAPASQAQPPLPKATNLWIFSFPTARCHGNTSQSTPAIAPDGTIYAGSFDGTLFAITPDGQEQWRFKTGREIVSSPAIGDDGTIYFGSRDRNFYAVTSAGKLKWAFATGAWVDASPAIAADGTIYFGSWDKTFYALNPDGTLKWKFAVGAIVDSSPAIAADGTIYFGAHDQYLYALNPDGSLRWKFLTGGEIIASPAIGAAGIIYFTALDGHCYALNPDGTKRWRYHTGSTTKSSPVVDAAGNLALGDNNCTSVFSKEGKRLWSRGWPLPINITGLAVPGQFYFSTPWHKMMALEEPGRPLWQADLEANMTASFVMDERGILYMCAARYLYAIQPPGPLLPPDASPWPMFRANARHTGRVGDK